MRLSVSGAESVLNGLERIALVIRQDPVRVVLPARRCIAKNNRRLLD